MQRKPFPWGSLADFSAPRFNCCEIKMVSEGIAVLLNEFVLNPLTRIQ